MCVCECVGVCEAGASATAADWNDCDSVIQGPLAFNGLLVLSVYNQFPVRKRGTVVLSFLKPMNSHSFLSAVSDDKLLIKTEGSAHKKIPASNISVQFERQVSISVQVWCPAGVQLQRLIPL